MAADDADPGDNGDPGDARQGIQSVENAMTVLLALEQGLGPMSLTQIAAASAMAPSTMTAPTICTGARRSPSSNQA